MTDNVSPILQSVLSFDGVDDRVVLTKPIQDLSNAVTIEFWANGNSPLTANTSVIEAHNTEGIRIVNIHLPWGNNRIYWDAGGNKTRFDRIDKAVQTSEYQNSWNHWAFIKNSTTGEMQIYRNGELWHSGLGNNLPFVVIETFTIGSYGNNSCYWGGLLAELRIWNIALSRDQIQANMHSRLTGKESGLVTYLPLDEGNGTTVKDQTLNSNNGTISGATWQQKEVPLLRKPTKESVPPKESIPTKENIPTMAKSKRNETAPETTEQNVSKSESTEAKKKYIPATGLEDYGRWKAMYQDHKRDKNEKPFRRGRIWC